MDIRWMKTFIICAKYENFRKASEELFLTQPAITKHIRRLEEHLNTQLFERSGKKVRLTQAGYKFLPYATELVLKYEQGIDNFESWKQGYNRKLTIATAPQIASSFLPSLLRAFIDENPDIEVIINVTKSFEIGGEISSGKADLGLSRALPLETKLKTEIIHEEPVILVGANLQNGASAIESEVLSNYRLITHNHPDYWDSLLINVRRHYPTVRTMVVNQIEVTKKFIENGLGVSYLPYSMVKDELANKKLTEVKSVKISPPTSSTYAITKIETNEARNFIKFLRDSL
ncbi:LysR family transcriptional regulator [Lysinibacillus endophyticus]|uniref:LysR family transcriptional regulator n=1 Tax=Ureibacillus endophyticus TaxID=1978490 RepID=A0A494YX88_9BACL|nr:LysR family transcriptional regulator [Lysinibacillus endophyticus]MCP1144547.1 LysR family transcriptional regulator [Lysinibacillus endophyticus]RKQ14841.1 LysR family transcriptional regulator [Lysinibacillus endophyticus]